MYTILGVMYSFIDVCGCGGLMYGVHQRPNRAKKSTFFDTQKNL